MVLTRYIVQFFSFVDCIKKWDWEKDGKWAEMVVKKKFDEDRKEGLWKKFRNVGDFTKRVCNCRCECECEDVYLEFITYKDYHRGVCDCKCLYKGVALNNNNKMKIIKFMKDFAGVKVDCNDFGWYNISDKTYSTFGWLEKYLIELFELSDDDIEKLRNEYKISQMRVYMSNWNILNIMSGSAGLRYSA